METMQENRLWFEADAEKRGIDQGLQEGQRHMLYSLVQDGDLPAAKAAKRLGITEEQLREDMLAADFPGVLS